EIAAIFKAGATGNCSVAIDIEPGPGQPVHQETVTGASSSDDEDREEDEEREHAAWHDDEAEERDSAARTVTTSAGLTGSQSSISVAILSSAGFNPSADVDPSSLTFGTTGNEASQPSCNPIPAVNGDGVDDLV